MRGDDEDNGKWKLRQEHNTTLLELWLSSVSAAVFLRGSGLVDQEA